MKPHDMLPDTDHDERARQDFVRSFRGWLAGTVMPANRVVFEQRVSPAFEEEHGRAPGSPKEVRERMTRDPYYQYWSAMQRRSQELMWESVIDPTERQLDALIERAATLSQNDGCGSLTLDPDLDIPRYHTAVDIHLQPGGYHTEFTDADVAAGVLYEAGLPIYINNALGPDSDAIGESLCRFAASACPELAPTRILDMGCAVGNSTLPWHRAHPDAELHAIDVAAPCLRYGHARARLYGVPVHFSQQNAERTNFESGSFDLVVSHIMLHETSKPALENVLAETWRLLKPGGVMLHLDIPRGDTPFDQFMMQWETYNNNETFSAFMTTADLPAMAVKAGFDAASVRMERAAASVHDGQKSYTTSEFAWPVLAGRKADSQ